MNRLGTLSKQPRRRPPYAVTFVSESAARNISAGVPTELIRGDVYFWPSLMAATTLVAIPLGIAYGLLFDYLVRGFQSAGARVTTASRSSIPATTATISSLSRRLTTSLSARHWRIRWAN